jgi:tetratricopeptide (TPR) repeat protein
MNRCKPLADEGLLARSKRKNSILVSRFVLQAARLTPPASTRLGSRNFRRVVSLACLFLGLAGGLTVVPIDLVVPAAQAQSVPAAVRQAQSLLQRGLVNDAIRAFQQALRSSPNSLEAKLGLAQAYQKAGQDAEAWTAYQRVLEQDPNNTPALQAVGVLGGYRPEWQARGIEALTTLLNQNPNDNQSRAQRALLLGYQGRYAESLADYQIVLQGNPSPDTILGAAQIYTYSGDYEQGLALFNRYQGTGKSDSQQRADGLCPSTSRNG